MLSHEDATLNLTIMFIYQNVYQAGGGMENARRKFQARKELLEDTDNLKVNRAK